MPSPSRRSSVLGWAGLLMFLLAIVAVAVPGIGYLQTMSDAGLSLNDGPQQVSPSSSRSYGIYVDDKDNSGYSEACSAVDADGGIQMDDPPWSISFSDTESLDLAFTAGPGVVTINCDIPGEQVTLRPLPDNRSLLIGFFLGTLLGCGGACAVIARTTRSPGAPTSPLPSGFGGAQSSTDAAPATSPELVRHRDLVPAIIAATIVLPVLGLTPLRWLLHISIVNSLWDDTERWNGGDLIGDRPSMWQTVQSTWTELIPFAIGVALVLAAWRLAWRDRTSAAWGATLLALVIGVATFAL